MAWVKFKGSAEFISYYYSLFLYHYSQYLRDISHKSINKSINNNLFGINVILIAILDAVNLTGLKAQPKIVVDPWYAFTKFVKFMHGYLILLAV